MTKRLILFTITSLAFGSCDTGKSLAQNKTTDSLKTPQPSAGPPILVYKTRKDYADLVPVLLSEDRSKIVSYPAPQDLRNSANPKPTALKDGYLLDNRGIGKHVAYLKLTYAAYAALEQAPSQKELMELIIDKEPLTELCNCGNRLKQSDPETYANELISGGKLRSTCIVIK